MKWQKGNNFATLKQYFRRSYISLEDKSPAGR